MCQVLQLLHFGFHFILSAKACMHRNAISPLKQCIASTDLFTYHLLQPCCGTALIHAHSAHVCCLVKSLFAYQQVNNGTVPQLTEQQTDLAGQPSQPAQRNPQRQVGPSRHSEGPGANGLAATTDAARSNNVQPRPTSAHAVQHLTTHHDASFCFFCLTTVQVITCALTSDRPTTTPRLQCVEQSWPVLAAS